MNSHWSGNAAADCEPLDAADAERHLGEIAPIAMERLHIGNALMRAAPVAFYPTDTSPAQNFRWAQGSGRSAEQFFLGPSGSASARQNVVNVLSARSTPPSGDLALARDALARLDARQGEDIEAWATRLATDLSRAGE